MKKILIITLIVVSINCKAQTIQGIIPVENFFNYQNKIPDGTYIKDINNVLDKFTGKWLGSYD